MKFCFLTDEFFELYKECEEIEKKNNRPYATVCLLKYNTFYFAIPIRHNIKHPYAIFTDKEKTNINFRLDKNLKEELDVLCDEIGITVTTAFTIFAKKFVRERRLPFTVDADPFYSVKNLERLKKSIEQLENKGGTVHEITEVLDD